MNDNLRTAYSVIRARLFARGFDASPARVLTIARADLERGASHYAAGPAINPRNDKGAAWVERPADVGLRFVGWSDEIARVGHNGWFLDDEAQDEVARGCVYQLPGRKGEARFVAGYRLGSESRTQGWSDQSGVEDSACLYLGEVFTEVASDEYVKDYDAARSAAYRADRYAERLAEDERDYQAAGARDATRRTPSQTLRRSGRKRVACWRKSAAYRSPTSRPSALRFAPRSFVTWIALASFTRRPRRRSRMTATIRPLWKARARPPIGKRASEPLC